MSFPSEGTPHILRKLNTKAKKKLFEHLIKTSQIYYFCLYAGILSLINTCYNFLFMFRVLHLFLVICKQHLVVNFRPKRRNMIQVLERLTKKTNKLAAKHFNTARKEELQRICLQHMCVGWSRFLSLCQLKLFC